MSNPIKAGEFSFQVENGGLMVTVGDQLRRLDPTESMKLLNYLDEHREEIQRAFSPAAAEPAPLSREWYGQKLNEAFENMPE
jgi:hypothetical protein